MPERDIQRLSIDTIRGLAMDAVQKANAGHPGTAMALAPLGYTLFTALPAPESGRHRDGPTATASFSAPAMHACCSTRCFISSASISASTTSSSSANGARARPGHPERGHTPGIEITTGPLGQGFANAVGMAIAERFLADRFNRPEPGDRRSPRLRDLLGRRSDGGHQPGGGLDRGALRRSAS